MKNYINNVLPKKTSDLINDSGFITSAPVSSVNGQTGAVVLSIPSKVSDLTNDSGFIDDEYVDNATAALPNKNLLHNTKPL